MATANPAMNEAVYERAGNSDARTGVMTIGGTVVKTGFLTLILLVAAGYVWNESASGAALPPGLLIAGLLGGFVTALLTIFVPRLSPFTSPVYAGLEGIVLGAISVMFEA